MKNWITLSAAFLLSALAVTAQAAADHRAEQKRIVALLNSDRFEDRVNGCRQIYFSGITSVRFFDVIERRLRKQYDKARVDGEGDSAQEMAWYAKSLASSGNPKYLATLQELQASGPGNMKNTFRYMQQAIDTLPKFTEWNKVINDESRHVAGQDWEITSAQNMLASNDQELANAGARRMKQLRKTHPNL